MAKLYKNFSLGDDAIGITASNYTRPRLYISLGYYAVDGHVWELGREDAVALKEMVDEFLNNLRDEEDYGGLSYE